MATINLYIQKKSKSTEQLEDCVAGIKSHILYAVPSDPWLTVRRIPSLWAFSKTNAYASTE
jgi:hypothetical protein